MVSYDDLLKIAQNPFSKENINKVTFDEQKESNLNRELLAQELRDEKYTRFCDEVMVTPHGQ